MKRLFSLEYSLEALAALLSLLAAAGVLQTFIIGKHFVIPTMVLSLAVLFGNLARCGLNDQRWAKHVLFWIFLVLVFHALFALMWAGEARPGQLLGAAFYPVYGAFAVGVGTATVLYAQRNRLFRP